MNVDCGSARDRLGQTLDDKYHLREVLGAGGTAVVFRAVSPDGEQVAVKMLHDHLSRSEEVCRRFVREGQLGNVLDHPGTVRVLDHGSSHDGCPYLVLEFLEGESLEDRRVRAGGRLDLWETLDFCDQLLAVLEVAHGKNVVHRDIKPSNLFVMANGRLKVLDFGIARLMEDTSATSTKTGQMVGTPAFMPPEQALSRPRDVDARTDIWAVGATLFTLLSGEHVHIAETSSEHLVKAATLHARSLAKALPGIPSHVEALVARCLAFDKNERWSSAASMRQELNFVRADPGRRIGTTSAPPPERTPSNPNMPTIVTESQRMRAYNDAPTTYSDGAIPLSANGGVPYSERRIDSVANMALSSNPGAYDLFPSLSRKKWLLPFAIASSLALIGMTIIALYFAFRTSGPVQVASANPSPSLSAPTGQSAATAAPTLNPADTEVIALDDIPATPEPAKSADSPASAVAPKPSLATAATPATVGAAPIAAPATFPVAAKPYQPSSSAPVGNGKKPGSRKDVYRPF